jgi:hypothetical protein
MPLATATVITSSIIQDNTQKKQIFNCTLQLSAPTDIYPVGGIPLKAVLAAALMPTTNRDPLSVRIYSLTNSGYIYTYIAATGTLMVLQVPPNGSLTTAAPLQQYPSAAISGIWADIIRVEVEYLRNAS